MTVKHKTAFKNLAAATGFCLLFLALFSVFSDILLDKEQTWYKHRNYTALGRDSVDILYVGNSHFNAAIDPKLVDEAAGMGTFGFNYSASGMRMAYAYHRLAHALQTQNPRLVVLDTFCLVPLAEGESGDNIVNWSLDGLPLSAEKLAAVMELAPFEDWPAYLVPFIKYHARWEYLKLEDVMSVFDASYYDWFGRAPETLDAAMAEEDGHFGQDLSQTEGEVPVDDWQMGYLERFIALCEAQGAKVLLFGTPYRNQFGQNAADGVRMANWLRARVVDGDAVQLADANEAYAAMGFTYADMRDDGHVNFAGAEKTSRFLADYIKTHYAGLFASL
jgi:hypothetical protein